MRRLRKKREQAHPGRISVLGFDISTNKLLVARIASKVFGELISNTFHEVGAEEERALDHVEVRVCVRVEKCLFVLVMPTTY